MKALRVTLFVTLALLLTAGAVIFLIARLTLAPGPDEWRERIRVGSVSFDAGMPSVIRLATSPWFAPWLAGRAIETRIGRVRFDWNEATGTLELQCAPCSAAVPALGQTPIRVDRLKATVRRNAETLGGFLEASAPGVALRGQWEGQLTQRQLQLDLRAGEAPIAHWYAVLAPGLTELQHARIGGTLRLRARLALPDGGYALNPQITGFTVEGLGTQALMDAQTSCGPASGLDSKSWLARAVISAEDQRFFEHPGYDLAELMASFEANQKAERTERGGSTLTQQLAKILVTGGEQSAARKLRELLYAVEMEQTLGKARILALYLDNAPWGARICGADAAARTYFKRPANRLEPAQAVWLATMLTNPVEAVRQWQRDGRIDPGHASRVADGVRGITKAQREALLRGVAVAQFAAP